MRKLVIAAAGILATCAVLGGVALAQSFQNGSDTAVTVKAKVSPNKAGTRKHPRGVRLSVHVQWKSPPQDERPIIQSAVALFPKGSLYNGGKYPRCSANTMNRKGLKACPKGSIMGKGTGIAYADTVLTRPQITVVNGGPHNVCLYTILNNPARVQACVPGRIKKRHGRWAYELDLKVPQVLQVVAGVPIQLFDFKLTAGRGTWLATTGCSRGKWPFSVTTSYDTGGSSGYTDSIRCRK